MGSSGKRKGAGNEGGTVRSALHRSNMTTMLEEETKDSLARMRDAIPVVNNDMKPNIIEVSVKLYELLCCDKGIETSSGDVGEGQPHTSWRERKNDCH